MVEEHREAATRALSPVARRRELIELVRQRGYVAIDAMARRFAVSAQTIRRDIRLLAERKELERLHGGAGLPPGSDTLAYTSRRVRHAREKRAIGRAVARHIPNATSLFIDIGTTTAAVANALVDHRGLRIVTNHIAVAVALSERTDFEIVLVGGIVRKRDQAVTGEAAVEALQRYKFAYGVFGIGTIDEDGELLDYDYRDMQLSRAAMAGSRQRLVVMDGSKFNGDAMVRLGHCSQIHHLFTDRRPPRPILRVLRAHRVAIHVAGRR